jgi:hypothetical protein
MALILTVEIADSEDGTGDLKVVVHNHQKRSGKELLLLMTETTRHMATITIETALKLGLTEDQAIKLLEG